MEKYLAQTQAILGLIQSTMDEESMENSTKAGEEIWNAIREITDKYDLTVQEMLNAALACHATIIEVATEQIDKSKDEEGAEHE